MKTPRKSPTAFTLIEVTLALGVASFCLLSVFGLVPVGLTANQNAAEQTAAAGIATAVSADLRDTLTAGGTTSRFQFQIPAASGNSVQTLYFAQNGTPTAAVGQNASGSLPTPSRYRATVTCQAENTTTPVTPRNKLFKVSILVSWPALADPSATTLPSNFSGSFQTTTSLDCN